ncbi:retrovirus-related Pol polyprotein from transposon 17.6 [Trichonephila clavipes]|nr:retrovirus-related Pol polyprotein from transposon 17.6 [Trichonephila clavipes]
MLVDKIKRCTQNQFKGHFVDEWATITSKKDLLGKIEEFENEKNKMIGGKMKLGDYKMRTADRQIGDSHSHGKLFKGNKTFQGTHFRNHHDARNSGKKPELNFDKRKRLQCNKCGFFNHLRLLFPNLKTQKSELCRIGVKSEGSFLDPYILEGKLTTPTPLGGQQRLKKYSRPYHVKVCPTLLLGSIFTKSVLSGSLFKDRSIPTFFQASRSYSSGFIIISE